MGNAEKRRALAPKRPILEGLDRYYWFFWGVLLLTTAFFLFFQLGHLPALDWDEARHGVNAYDNTNPTQAYMAQSLPQPPEMRGANAYWEISGVENPSVWRQGDVLMAELTADLKCQNGGIQAFLADRGGAILFVADDVFAAHSAQLEPYRVLGEKDGLLCIFHDAP